MGGYIVFGADLVRIGVRFFVSMHYLLNQSMDFDQTCIDILLVLGRGEELIRLIFGDLVFNCIFTDDT